MSHLNYRSNVFNPGTAGAIRTDQRGDYAFQAAAAEKALNDAVVTAGMDRYRAEAIAQRLSGVRDTLDPKALAKAAIRELGEERYQKALDAMKSQYPDYIRRAGQ